MIDFIASLGIFGWLLLAVPILAIIFRRRLRRGEGASKLSVDKVPPVGEPPHDRGST